ncbi:transcription repressor NadR [Anaeromicropila herbilytica]|uniref:Putative transcription repressor NiaR n=1 Tax=Anaeromicropila herbilytica TaxID=2785025 RepID=A0A7R7IEP3_9FIRM|nr:transcription repressor NadR [Anaeromicropila herbilytica]BCN32913.1 putative transcription repressor NiaR [Anaeromicropila herbilytica]
MIVTHRTKYRGDTMEGKERREKILEILKTSTRPISGSELSKQLGVSRQIIVQDIALLRAVNKNILSTTKGYVLYYQEKEKVNRCYLVKHTTDEIEDELCTIVDFGGKILDVIVSHEIYGQIVTDLIISTRQEVYEFVNKIKTKKTVPLKELADGVHLHTVEADSEEILDRIEQALKNKGYLV